MTSKCFADHDITVLDWQANMPRPEPHMESMGYFLEKDEKQSIQQSRQAEGSLVPQQWHRPDRFRANLTDAGICAKGAPTKYWVHKWTYFKELNFSVLRILFIQLFNGFLTFMSCKF